MALPLGAARYCARLPASYLVGQEDRIPREEVKICGEVNPVLMSKGAPIECNASFTLSPGVVVDPCTSIEEGRVKR